MLFKTNNPYPKPQVESKNIDYAYILLQSYAGQVSEESAIHLYLYQHLVKKDINNEFSNILAQISMVEMHHLELLGETIKLLGLNPEFKTLSPNGEMIPWTADNIKYDIDIKRMLEIDIDVEIKAIENYKLDYQIIQDKYIKNLLARIIEDEYIHLDIFEKLYQKLC